VKKQA